MKHKPLDSFDSNETATTVDVDSSKIDFRLVDDIYHSTSMHEMLVKADLYGIDMQQLEVLKYLANTTAYHHAFWPHTAKRFTAFKAYLRTCKDLPDKDFFEDLREFVTNEMIRCEVTTYQEWEVPGARQETKNWKQVLDILDKLKANSIKRKAHHIDKKRA